MNSERDFEKRVVRSHPDALRVEEVALLLQLLGELDLSEGGSEDGLIVLELLLQVLGGGPHGWPLKEGGSCLGVSSCSVGKVG